MFFSARDLYNHAVTENEYIKEEVEAVVDQDFSIKAVQKYVAVVKKAIVARQYRVPKLRNNGYYWDTEVGISKWYRPWYVVPSVKNFQAPEGDFGIGVEIEMGFVNKEAASTIASKISGWRNIAVDAEGGAEPIEATFPPFCYSKLSNRSQPMRYVKLLADNDELVYKHDEDDQVGTHINVSAGGGKLLSECRVHTLDDVLTSYFPEYTNLEEEVQALAQKYFGRIPYGGAYGQSWETGGYKYVEYKLFNSTTDRKALRRYINIAVALTELIVSTTTINTESVLAALEAGYNKR